MPTVPEIITENIIKQLEQGVAPWRKPWSTSMPRNLISKKPYRGLNVFLLATQGYGSPYWLTFNQAKQLGAHVRQGEKSTLVSFWKFNEYGRQNHETGETENKTSVLLRYYRVFNIEQCEGLKALQGDDCKPANPISECESIANRMPNPPKFEQHSQAFYRPSADVVGMPSRNCFETPEAFYSTLFHELTHSTGHKSRLNRFEENSTDQSIRLGVLQQRRTHSGDGRSDALRDGGHFARDSGQFRKLSANVDSPTQVGFPVDYLRRISRTKSSRLHSRQNANRRG